MVETPIWLPIRYLPVSPSLGHFVKVSGVDTANWSTADKHCAVLRDMSCSRTICLEGELFNEGRTLIKVAVANPPRPDHEICDAGPAQVAAAFWPSGEIHFLVVRKHGALGLVGFTLVLHRDFARPPYDERTTGI